MLLIIPGRWLCLDFARPAASEPQQTSLHDFSKFGSKNKKYGFFQKQFVNFEIANRMQKF